MIKLLQELNTLYKIEILIKSSTDVNQVLIYNEIRGIDGVVVVTVEQNDFLKGKGTDKVQYALLKMKYLVESDPVKAADEIRRDALQINRIPGLIQFIPRHKTIKKVGQY